jgi:predicted ribosome quality control (RQC) complex YloA/Tae2 family protein
MTETELTQIGREIAEAMIGIRVGKIFPLGPGAIAIDFFPHEGRYLYISFARGNGITYLIRRRLKDLERSSTHASPFVIELRKICFGMELKSVYVDPDGLAIRLELESEERSLTLIIQLGRRPNLLVLDAGQTIILAGHASDATGQRVGDAFDGVASGVRVDSHPTQPPASSLSDVLDARERSRERDESFDAQAATAKRKINGEIRKKEKLLQNLEADLAKHGDPEEWKRLGDLLLANIGNIRREGDRMIVIDYFDERMPEVEIPVEGTTSPTEMAEIFFARYTKARNGAAAIATRQDIVRKDLETLRSRLSKLEEAIDSRDDEALSSFESEKRPAPVQAGRKKAAVDVKGARRFISTDGFEILVGKKAVDNDHLTFRVARSTDLWLHAEDYPGSHVIVRNPGRKEIPQRTLIEAAQLAAFYSDARELPKASVRYTQRKFVNKPRRAAPGLVSLSSFRSILVAPGVGDLSPAS